jgi:hypothetical protein
MQLLGLNESALNDILNGVNITEDTPKLLVGFVKRFMSLNVSVAKKAVLLIWKFSDICFCIHNF